MRNNRGQVVIDRRFNTSQLVSLYLDKPVPEDVITWNPDNPNQLRLALPGLHTMLFFHLEVVYIWLLSSAEETSQSARLVLVSKPMHIS